MSSDKSLNWKKIRRGSRGKRQSVTSCKDEEKEMLESLVETSIQDDRLSMLNELFNQFPIFKDLKPKLKYEQSPEHSPKHSPKYSPTILCETQQQTRSSSSGYDTDTTQSSIHLTSHEGISRPIYRAADYSVTHNSSQQDENESTEKRKERNRTMSNTTNYPDTYVSSDKDTDVTICKCDAKSKSSKVQKTASTCKSISKHVTIAKHKVKSKEVELDDLPQLQENKADTHDKSSEKSKQTKTAMAKKSMKKNIKKDESHTGTNDKVKEIKNIWKTRRSQENNVFPDHIPLEEMKEILKNQTPDNIQYVKGTFRINPKYNNYAYLSMEEEGERDLLINGTIDRNRAFEGDLVVARINPVEDWQTFANGELQKTAVVVCILEEVHPRKAIGYLVQHVQKNKPFVLLRPKDLRVPFIRIYSKSLPFSYHSQPDSYDDVIFFINIICWTSINYALGEILWTVGTTDDITAELSAVLLENNLNVSPYKEELLKGLPSTDYVLTDVDIKDREDWRNECIFTIDPITAVDLDDAVSCKILENGNYEIGVHVSDVTHYFKFFSPLDKEISRRATTVYLPHTCYHMLPEQLCVLCSLLPGKDRLAFSVIWEMTPNAEIVKHRFAKTVVSSCCKVSYDIAQLMIENAALPEKALDIKGDYTVSTISDIINYLFKLSVIMRDRRFSSGALRLDQPKIQICIDPTMIQQGILVPVNYQLEEKKDSNRLIEEFMLLANMTVAAHLYDKVPETALLRIHKEPTKHSLSKTSEILQKYGVHLDIETAGTLYASIKRYEDLLECNSSTVNNTSQYVMMVIMNICSKAMARAEYKCASTISSVENLKHYALNAPFYTHFTSPIRRYSDCIVHRLLNATIQKKPMSEKWTATLCSRIATNCNIKKYSAKLAQEQSIELLFTHMVGLAGGFNTLAAVLEVKERCMDVMLCDTGVKLRIEYNSVKHSDATVQHSVDFSVSTVTVKWKTPPVTQKINMFSLIHVQVVKSSNKFRLIAKLLHPSSPI